MIEGLGHECAVIAPSLIPRRPGARVKTNRRDAVKLARLYRAGELTDIWTPDEAHEALRDLVRAREAAVKDRTRKRQEIRSFLLRHGKIYPGKKAWGTKYFKWLGPSPCSASARGAKARTPRPLHRMDSGTAGKNLPLVIDKPDPDRTDRRYHAYRRGRGDDTGGPGKGCASPDSVW